MEKIYESIYIFMKHDGSEATYWINIDESNEKIELKKNSNIIHKLINDSKSYLRNEKIKTLLNQILQ
jgi:hypothetical protein